jgi:DNA-binding CsgD family transcriptional regulator
LPEVTTVKRGEAHAWARVAAHVAAGLRLRRGKAPMAAVLSPTGKVEHAEDAAKGSLEALRDGARAMVDAQRSADVPSGLEAWRALVDGRFSLVDQFDHDGKRYVVAFRNDPAPPSLHASLTDREAQVLGYLAQGHANKLIGYELGLSPSTVAMHLSNASAKLGAKSRVELVRIARNLSAEEKVS